MRQIGSCRKSFEQRARNKTTRGYRYIGFDKSRLSRHHSFIERWTLEMDGSKKYFPSVKHGDIYIGKRESSEGINTSLKLQEKETEKELCSDYSSLFSRRNAWFHIQSTLRTPEMPHFFFAVASILSLYPCLIIYFYVGEKKLREYEEIFYKRIASSACRERKNNNNSQWN